MYSIDTGYGAIDDQQCSGYSVSVGGRVVQSHCHEGH